MNDILLYFFISHVMIGIASIFIGCFVLIEARNKINVVFFVWMLSIAMWSLFYVLWLVARDSESALLFSRTLTFFAVFIPTLYFHWLLLFLGKAEELRLRIFLIYILGSIILLFSYSDFVISEVKSVLYFTYYPQSNFLHLIFLGMWTVIIIYGTAVLCSEYKKAKGKTKKQILFVLIGGNIGFIGGSFDFFPMLGIETIPPFASALVLVFPLFFGYAMMKYNLMNIRLVFIKSIIILLNAFAIGFIFVSNSHGEYIAKIIFAIMIFILSYFLQKSFNKEVKQKEELLRLSNELKRANVELKRLDKAKSEFISIASHQLRTPLTAIKGYISLVLEGAYGKNEEKTSDALNKVFLANERLIQLVEDLLNITRIESGRLELHLDDRVCVEELVEELRDMFILRAEGKGLDLVVDLPRKKLSLITADRSKLREVISNLIDNAIKYTKVGFVHVSMTESDGVVRVIIEDSGVGISDDSMKTLFTKFSRGTDSSKIYTEGTGLGLYVGKNLVESQGGRIYAESDGVDKGSRFIVEMPVGK